MKPYNDKQMWQPVLTANMHEMRHTMEKKVTRKIPIVTVTLIAVNVLIWLVLELIGDTTDGEFMLAHGAAFVPYIIEDHEWWRLFTSMFLHFGAEHLVNNMLLLAVIGMRLENVLGKIPFTVVYLFSGLCGSILSAVEDIRYADYAVSAGASGAIFGILGALIAWAAFHKWKVEGLTMKGLLFMAVLSLYYGFSTAGVDNWGHIGGLCGGFLAGCIVALIRKFRD